MFIFSGVATELAVESCAINSFDVDLELGSVSILTFQLLHCCRACGMYFQI